MPKRTGIFLTTNKIKLEIMKIKIVTLLLAVTGSFCNLNAQTSSSTVPSAEKGWIKILDKAIDTKRNRDEINVVNTDRFLALKVVSKNADINLYGLEVFYEGGNGQFIEVREALKSGKASYSYDLESSKTDIKQVAFTYKAIPNSKKDKNHLEVWGFRSPNADLK